MGIVESLIMIQKCLRDCMLGCSFSGSGDDRDDWRILGKGGWMV
jgi:hypothetical protein